MTSDPIVEEIRETRARLLADCHEDLNELLDRYQAHEEQVRDRLVTVEDVRKRRKQRRPAPALEEV